MIDYLYVGDGARLIKSEKTNWTSGVTPGPKLFIHGGPMGPAIARQWGLTPEKASEFLVHATDVKNATGNVIHPEGSPIAGGKMLFAFPVADGFIPPVRREKPAAVSRLWGFDGHSYLFKVPAGTVYWSYRGEINPAAEVAFPYLIESADIVEYWGPSKNYIYKVGEGRAPRLRFPHSPW